MIDFTSSLYLGMKHSKAELANWQQLTLGVPSALFEPTQSKELADKVCRMQGLNSGLTAPSTLHLYYDLYTLLSKEPVIIFIDEKIYPVSKYGIEKLFFNKIAVYRFGHLDAVHLKELITSKTGKLKPVVITDGWCPQCGMHAPLDLYSEILKPFAGNIITDDTQAMGLLGKRTNREMYGKGGGGILQWLNLNDSNLITITSLAKAFGVPLAIVSGPPAFIKLFKNVSETAVYSSPASMVHINAGLHALHINNTIGDYRRKKLFNNVYLIRSLLEEVGVKVRGGIFPVQSISFRNADSAKLLFNNLNKQGIKTALTEGHTEERSVTFVIRYDHSIENMEELAYYIQKLLPVMKF